ncbi:hypothetical protein Pmani_019424 [Petrolisthes manimaculis]|uniref:THAP-type domain-containing protein n=1 Tax=Petrolisthes manimaculis TaxID=1843537 RepID=A0AAE1U7P1_9EUCA|nr:hypothetical protein Pmani_024342 [Petrolisthes manimaculis]KAK4308899.1 hypothetical protein Pmani_019424 [Petrolisthes manimaculis]
MSKAHIYCCEDHFNLKEDMENYLYYSMMGGHIRIKPGVRPHKFDCQGKVTPHNENRDRLQRKRMVLEILSSKENIMEPDQNPASWPDPEDQRMEHDGHIDPQPLIPSTKDIGIQVQVNSRKRSKVVQVQPVQADAMNNTDGQDKVDKMKKTESTSADSVSTSEEL